uniref:Ig-like domain-containing protein n=1 Tax=Castor canadensis TaxID=51338 RepID=A0A8C0WRL9_CASCN
MDGSQVTMTVQVSGNPPPEVIWLHNGNEIQESEDFHFEQRGAQHSLCIQEVFPEDRGTYTCEAWNSAGEVRSQAVLTVQEPHDGTQPWFISKPRSVTASLGQSVLISCAIAGDPFPTVHWLRGGKALSKDTGHFEVLQNEDVFTLVLKNVQPWHAGQYEILLKNRVGECSCQVSLMLQNNPARAPLWGREPASCEGLCGGGVGADGGGDQDGTLKPGQPARGQGWPEEEDGEDVRGVLKRRVETRLHTEEAIRQQEVEQLDFRDLLGKKVSTKTVSEEDLKEIPAEQMDFRANLQRQVKPKTVSEEERKVDPVAEARASALILVPSSSHPTTQERRELGGKGKGSLQKQSSDSLDRRYLGRAPAEPLRGFLLLVSPIPLTLSQNSPPG